MIKVDLLRDRTKVGRLTLISNEGIPLCGPFPALGLADNAAASAHHNHHRDPVLPFGDTPTGGYKFSIINTPLTPKHSYGPYGAISLDPISGDALSAEQHGRSGLLIHSGDPGANGNLRPTHGCIRLFDADLKTLLQALSQDHSKHECLITEKQGQAALHSIEHTVYSHDSAALKPDIYPLVEGLGAAHKVMPVGLFSLDTNLKTTKSDLTAKQIDDFFKSREEGKRALAGIGQAVISTSEKTGVNATYIAAHAAWETGWGTSNIFRDKNNLFGWSAYDHSPYASATKFASPSDCIAKVIPVIEKNYLTPGGIYFVSQPCLGNKIYGMNVHYASDKNWGAGIASIGRSLEHFAGQPE